MATPPLTRARAGLLLAAAACAAALGQGPARADAPAITCAISGSFTASPGVTTSPGRHDAQGSGASLHCVSHGRDGGAPQAARVATSGTLTGTCASIAGTLSTTITWIMPGGGRRTSVMDWRLDPGSSMIAATGSGAIEPGGYLAGHRTTVSVSDPAGDALACAEGGGDTGHSDQGILSIR